MTDKKYRFSGLYQISDEFVAADNVEFNAPDIPSIHQRLKSQVKQKKQCDEAARTLYENQYKSSRKADGIYTRIYRAIRVYKGRFSASDISSIAESPLGQARRFIAVLESASYIRTAGYANNTEYWVSTSLCRNSPIVPLLNYKR